jgi:flagellar biosynthesis/type III secretory pathway M-ring protein FliF/YscJ
MKPLNTKPKALCEALSAKKLLRSLHGFVVLRHMSEAFQKLLEQRQQRSATEARQQKWLLVAGGIALVLVVLFLLWRGQSQPVNPNTATREQLMTLPEVGPEIADRILKLRPFTDAADMEKRVKGIGPKTLEQMKKALDFDGDGSADCCVP